MFSVHGAAHLSVIWLKGELSFQNYVFEIHYFCSVREICVYLSLISRIVFSVERQNSQWAASGNRFPKQFTISRNVYLLILKPPNLERNIRVNESVFLTSAPVVGICSLLRKSFFFVYSIQNFVACNRELMSFILPYLLFYQLPTFKRNSVKEVKIYF